MANGAGASTRPHGPGQRAKVAGPRSRAVTLRRCSWLGLFAAAVLAASWRNAGHAGEAGFVATQQVVRRQRRRDISRASGNVLNSISNPVKTVAETIDEFYKNYPQPPVLPMYRSFLIDFLTQTHLTVVDARFTYDAVFALGLQVYYEGLMGSYDKLVGGGDQSKQIWKAFIKAVGMDPEKVTADAEAVKAYAIGTAPAQILQHMEGTEAASDKQIADAFSGISKSLYSISFSIGLFKLMELGGVETSKANVEEWAKALKIPPSKISGDLETYKLNKNKLQKAEEMLREVEIREKKKLAERLEEKAKKLAAKAAEKAKAAEGGEASTEETK